MLEISAESLKQHPFHTGRAMSEFTNEHIRSKINTSKGFDVDVEIDSKSVYAPCL